MRGEMGDENEEAELVGGDDGLVDDKVDMANEAMIKKLLTLPRKDEKPASP